jgi:hypothetical protein
VIDLPSAISRFVQRGAKCAQLFFRFAQQLHLAQSFSYSTSSPPRVIIL